MMIERTKDAKKIKSILSIDGLWETISDDNATKDNFIIDADKDCYLLVKDDDLVVGCFKVEAVNSCCIIAHINIIPKYRKKYSKLAGLAFYNWVVSNDFIKKVTVNIPVLYENVKKYCLAFGFKEEGLNRESILKGGKMADQWIMGITREEIKGALNEFN
ncbi:DUF2824 family protein [Pseudoalteromonas sp.]|uniref:DUF2824 family protein n=1 Tax=Pseudoalteromonas sp. TaxID=53249 RepID=UPI0035649B10